MPKIVTDFSGAEIDDGIYRFFIEKATVRESKNNPGLFLVFLDLVVQGGVKDGFKLQTNVNLNSPHPGLQTNCKRFLAAATGMPWASGQDLDIDDEGQLLDVLNRTVGAKVETREDKDGVEQTQVRLGTWCDPEKVPVDDGSVPYPYEDEDPI